MFINTTKPPLFLQSTPRQLHSHLPLCSPHLSGRRLSREGGGRSRRPTRCSRKWERPRGSPQDCTSSNGFILNTGVIWYCRPTRNNALFIKEIPQNHRYICIVRIHQNVFFDEKHVLFRGRSSILSHECSFSRSTDWRRKSLSEIWFASTTPSSSSSLYTWNLWLPVRPLVPNI